LRCGSHKHARLFAIVIAVHTVHCATAIALDSNDRRGKQGEESARPGRDRPRLARHFSASAQAPGEAKTHGWGRRKQLLPSGLQKPPTQSVIRRNCAGFAYMGRRLDQPFVCNRLLSERGHRGLGTSRSAGRRLRGRLRDAASRTMRKRPGNHRENFSLFWTTEASWIVEGTDRQPLLDNSEAPTRNLRFGKVVSKTA
jgi:hypothetical protein